MKGKTRSIAVSAIMSALTLVFLYLASIFPTGQLGFIAVASLFSVAAVIDAGVFFALLMYVCCALLSLLIIPLKGVALLYILFFGYYPVVKSAAERINTRALGWGLKFTFFFVALSIVWFLFRTVILSSSYAQLDPIIVYIGGAVVFALYDLGLTKLIAYYMARISPKFKRK